MSWLLKLLPWAGKSSALTWLSIVFAAGVASGTYVTYKMLSGSQAKAELALANRVIKDIKDQTDRFNKIAVENSQTKAVIRDETNRVIRSLHNVAKDSDCANKPIDPAIVERMRWGSPRQPELPRSPLPPN